MRRFLRGFLLLVAPLVSFAATPWGYAPRPDLADGRYLKVLAEASARLAAAPRDAAALAAKSQALSALMRFPEAMEAAQAALAADPELADAHLARGQARAGTAVQQRNLGSLRQVAGAMGDLRAAVARDRTLQPAWLTLGIAYQQLPGLLGGSTRKALECADALAALSPARGAALRGTVLALDGRWWDAEPAFQTALAAGPGDPQVVAAYLSALAEKSARRAIGESGQRTRLATEARRLLPAVRGRGRGLEAIGEALLEAGQPEEAWSALEAALPQAEAPSLVRLMLGKLAARAGIHRKEGLTHLDQVVREPLEGGSGGLAAAHWRRGQILRDLGRPAEARLAAQAALKLDPRHRGAGELLASLGEPQ